MRAVPLSVALLAGLAGVAEAEVPILGGTSVDVGDFPTVVAIGDLGLCTGTLIHPEWVLTAAHCISPSVIGVGTQAQVTANTTVYFDSPYFMSNNGFAVDAAETIPNPGFSLAALGDNDIGLIRLARPVTDREPSPINRQAASAPVGVNGVIMVGYGETGSGAGAPFVVRDRTSISCNNVGESDSLLLCYSQEDGRGKCSGDSGGPSFLMLNGRLTVIGVTSFGDQNCQYFGADTRVDAELAFLDEHLPACTTDDECGDLVCDNGQCITPPFGPGGIGSVCVDSSECNSDLCAAGPGGMKCTQICTPADTSSCPSGFDCIETGSSGACWPSEGEGTGGCCSASSDARGGTFLLAGLAALILRRRRRS